MYNTRRSPYFELHVGSHLYHLQRLRDLRVFRYSSRETFILHRDIRENNAKKKENRINVDKPDPKRWVKEDLERGKRLIDAGSSLVKEASNIEKDSSPKPVKKRMDLSKMTDSELRQAISREQLERQYNDMFGKTESAKISNGRNFVRNTLEIAGTTLAVGSSALSIALAIKELKG